MAATTDVGATDSLKVFCRVRPTPSVATRKCVTVENASHIVVNARKFTLDWVADEGETQEAVFDSVGKPMSDAFLAGYVLLYHRKKVSEIFKEVPAASTAASSHTDKLDLEKHIQFRV